MGVIFSTHKTSGPFCLGVIFNTHTGIFLGTWAHQNTDSTNIRTGNFLDTRIIAFFLKWRGAIFNTRTGNYLDTRIIAFLGM